MSMFCYQCQEAMQGKGCTRVGMCGKNERVAGLQDLLIYSLKGISQVVEAEKISPEEIETVNHQMLKALFMTITNANFDEEAIEKQIYWMIELREELKERHLGHIFGDAASFQVADLEGMLLKAQKVGVLATANEDIRSLRELIVYGLKGMAAYTHHALQLGKENKEIYTFMYEALAATLNESLSVEDLVALTLKTGEFGVKAMALLDEANTGRYGHPEITKVNIGVRNNPAILISGHDLTDLAQLLEQTQGTGVDVYTHSEMLPAHYYPMFKKYGHFVGNYGNV